MNDLIAVFRMNELSVETRIEIIKKLGVLINAQYSSNITEPLVIELVLALDPNNDIEQDNHYGWYKS